jgi:hypothetical protein
VDLYEGNIWLKVNQTLEQLFILQLKNK